jgi:hypothetical protein
MLHQIQDLLMSRTAEVHPQIETCKDVLKFARRQSFQLVQIK